MVTAGLIAGVLSGCYPEQNKGEEVNTSSHEVSVVVEKQPKQSVEQDEEDVEGIPGLRRGEG